MKYLLILAFLGFGFHTNAQEISNSDKFWATLSAHCGKSYEGKLVTPDSDPRFAGRLVMHVRNCDETTLRIPFFVGDDLSRTWVLTKENGLIQLKHDHRHEDGSEDKVTQYGGMASNTGTPKVQFFPADQFTADMLPAAVGNVWWMTVDETSFTYNLKRLGGESQFTVKFDLTNPIETPPAPWGWKD
jgi:hypothetical protein